MGKAPKINNHAMMKEYIKRRRFVLGKKGGKHKLARVSVGARIAMKRAEEEKEKFLVERNIDDLARAEQLQQQQDEKALAAPVHLRPYAKKAARKCAVNRRSSHGSAVRNEVYQIQLANLLDIREAELESWKRKYELQIIHLNNIRARRKQKCSNITHTVPKCELNTVLDTKLIDSKKDSITPNHIHDVASMSASTFDRKPPVSEFVGIQSIESNNIIPDCVQPLNDITLENATSQQAWDLFIENPFV